MVIIEDNIVISEQEIAKSANAEELEQKIAEMMQDSLCEKMKDSLSEMALLDMEQSEDGSGFEIKASVVLTTTQDMLSSLQMLARILSEIGLDEEDIDKALSVFETKGGF